AKESVVEAKLLAANGHWNTTVNRLYYTLFYAAHALLLMIDVNTKTHSGTKSKFHEHYILTKILSTESGSLYSKLFDLRQLGDYETFKIFTKQQIEPYILKTELFLKSVENLLEYEH
ncbi:MAG: hypothetical protein DRJ05_14375, partial [Bacteroidetes bacterium]